ncbi:MAG: hypothetical protein LBC73_03055 [Oscillospiraceae bacterium]|jgi:cell shape-determining protein MreD|nr:hypothetical protein [Oscillospiraceae bacterium]
MRRKVLIVSILLHAALLITVYVFQGVILPFLRIGGLVPLLLPTAVAGVALYEGRYVGGLTGLFAGILCDISFNQPVGIFTVTLTVIGLSIGALSDAVILQGFATYYLMCAASLVICTFVQIVPLVVFLQIPFYALIGTAIGQLVYSLILAFPLWFFIRALGKRADRIGIPRRAS